MNNNRKREATPEQKQRSAERRAMLREIVGEIAKMDEAERLKIAHSYGIRTIEGHELSAHNTILCARQRCGVSIVGGIRQWRAQGRKVRKGEKALGIWCPSARAKEQGQGDGQAVEHEELANGETRSFIVGWVFDISQTEET